MLDHEDMPGLTTPRSGSAVLACRCRAEGFLRLIADEHRARLAILRRIAAVVTKLPSLPPAEPMNEADKLTLTKRKAAVAASRAEDHAPA